MVWCVFCVWLVMGCQMTTKLSKGQELESVEAYMDSSTMIRYRSPLKTTDIPEAFTKYSQGNPSIHWDQGLQRAAQELISVVAFPQAMMRNSAMQLAADRAGYPGQSQFIKILNTGEFPVLALASIGKKYSSVDVGYATRRYADGTVLWIIAWAKHVLEMEPIPLQIPLDSPLPIRVDGIEPGEQAFLYIDAPDRPIEKIQLLSGAHRWLQDFHVPGRYRMEVVVQKKILVGEHWQSAEQSEIALLFSVYVDQELPKPSMQTASFTPSNPMEAEDWLYKKVNELRVQRGLHPLQRFSLFESIVREHSALMANTGNVEHFINGVTNGVAEKSAKYAHPRARHYQNVAAAITKEDALDLAIDSPGHFQVLLCQTCTHMSIGVALEPTISTNPRLFVTWEVLEFPDGVPQKIDKLQRNY